MEDTEAEGKRFEQFRSWHDEAYLYINQAITQEKPEISRSDVALMMYQRGLGLLDQALCVDTQSGSGGAWDKARKMQTKMSKTRSHVESRIRILTDELAPPIESKPPPRPPPPQGSPLPPSYDQATTLHHAPPPYSRSQESNSRPLMQEAEVVEISDDDTQPEAGNLQNSRMMTSETNDSMSSSVQGEILFSMSRVQVFHVSASGEVTTPSNPETLHVIKFSEEDTRGGAPAFIEVGTWTYPLLKGRSPVLRSQFGGYMFPDLEGGVTGDAVGVLVPDEVSTVDREIFESLLSELTTSFKTQEEVEEEYAEYKEFSSTLAVGLVKGAEVVGKGMVKGAVKTSELLFHGADMAKQYITPETTAREVDPRLKQGLAAASWVSHGACRVSGWMVSKVGSATMALGRMAAPHLERGATRALTNLTNQSNTESSNQLKIAGEIASGTVAAVSTMYMALENSSKILAKNMANNTVMIVSHKYGTDMAAVTSDALSTAGNSYLAFYNAAALGPKGIAKRAAKDTGKAMIGVDQEAVDQRARVAPDKVEGVKELLEVVENTNKSKGKGL